MLKKIEGTERPDGSYDMLDEATGRVTKVKPTQEAKQSEKPSLNG
jgi:hypothetical protein